jgi:hypothetical protein
LFPRSNTAATDELNVFLRLSTLRLSTPPVSLGSFIEQTAHSNLNIIPDFYLAPTSTAAALLATMSFIGLGILALGLYGILLVLCRMPGSLCFLLVSSFAAFFA